MRPGDAVSPLMIATIKSGACRFLSRGALIRFTRRAVPAYLGFLTLLYLFQDRMIFPGAGTQGQMGARVRPRADAELLELRTRTGERLAALYGRAVRGPGDPELAGAQRPTVICFYGNGTCLQTALPEFDRLRRLGLNVLIPEYLGYGMSDGSPSERGCQATADAAYDYLVLNRRVDPTSIISAGWSLGGAVAIDLASRRTVGGLIAFSTFTSVAEVAGRLLPFVPVSLILRSRFESLRKIATIRCPILIAHGRRDNTIPFQMGERLAAAAGGPVTTVWIAQASHKHLFEVGGARLDEAINTFAERCAHATLELAPTGLSKTVQGIALGK
jgi:pimeloyl-ACP methyl ester carboxylesterase